MAPPEEVPRVRPAGAPDTDMPADASSTDEPANDWAAAPTASDLDQPEEAPAGTTLEADLTLYGTLGMSVDELHKRHRGLRLRPVDERPRLPDLFNMPASADDTAKLASDALEVDLDLESELLRYLLSVRVSANDVIPAAPDAVPPDDVGPDPHGRYSYSDDQIPTPLLPPRRR